MISYLDKTHDKIEQPENNFIQASNLWLKELRHLCGELQHTVAEPVPTGYY